MKILFVADLDARSPFGQHTRPYFISRELATRHSVWMIARHAAAVGDIRLTNTDGTARRLAAAIFGTDRAWRPDVIYAHQNRAAALCCAIHTRAPVVADFHAVASSEWLGYLKSGWRGAANVHLAAHYVQARLAERVILSRADGVIAAGSEVAAALERRRPRRERIVAIGNGIDPRLLEVRPGLLSNPFREGRHLVATIPAGASPSNAAALELLESIASRLNDVAPDVVVHVLGSTRPSGETTSVRYHGIVPDILPYLWFADGCLLPYRSEMSLRGGVRNKTLEALAIGGRTVTTDEGLRGIEEAGSWAGVYRAPDDSAGFVDALLQALNQEPLSQRPRRELAGSSWAAAAQKVEFELTRYL